MMTAAMTTYQWKLETDPALDDVEFLRDRLYDYNVEQTGRDDGQYLSIFLRDEEDRIVAGVYGWTWAGWLRITEFWVSPEERRRGRGRQMLLMAEKEARGGGCSRAAGGTYNFSGAGVSSRFC